MVRRSAAARTAFGPMVIAAVEQFEPAGQRIATDPLAARFLPAGLALVVRSCRWRRLRTKLIDATDAKAAGIWGGVLCRKRYADDGVTAAVAGGIDQVIVLGAGMDTRGYRLVGPARVFEVDLPANIDTKRARVLATFDIDRPVVVVWEAVTQYLTEDAVRHTLTWLAKAATGSRLLFTYVRRDFLDGTTTYGAEGAYRDFVQRHRVWHFGLTPDQVAPLLADHGWTEDEQVGTVEYLHRYVEPAGRAMPVSEIERFVTATTR